MMVLNACQELEAQGVIYSVQKSGYFVAPFYPSSRPHANSEIRLNKQVEINSLVFRYLKSITDIEPQPVLSGNVKLRKLIAQRYRLQGIPTQADDIVITSGCLDALNLSLQALTQQGDYILLQQTVFYGAWQIAEKLGLNVVTLPDHPSGFVAFEQALQRYPIKVCWFMLNCHNPLGFTVSPEIKQRIGELLAQYQVHLIEDDVYQELYYRGEKPLPMKAFDAQNWVLHCSSFSKILGANFRIGWVHAGQFADKIQHLQLMSTISANALIQQALVEFISNHHYEKHLRHLRRHLEKNKKQCLDYLRQHLSASCPIEHHSSGYFLWIHLPEHLDSMRIYQQLLEEKISVSPSELFTLPTSQHKGIRVNCSYAWNQEIEQALGVLVRVLAK
ncbi:PLP-dependent aminotransferase family protein [Glaesserella parasuis]|nr:PLP-dependent aminotransferase family protein [Glaesserella parasuis]